VRTYVRFTFDVCCLLRMPCKDPFLLDVVYTKDPCCAAVLYRHVCGVRRKFNSDNVCQQNYRVLNERLCS
jgi:hypothetical protein